jgi:DNA-nicking Smr family endonuclease
MEGEDGAVSELPIDGELDLHAFAPRDALSVAEEYLLECRRRGILRVRIAHGRGKGVQRAQLRSLLRRLDFVAEAFDAPPGAGGWGATVAVLRALDHSAAD